MGQHLPPTPSLSSLLPPPNLDPDPIGISTGQQQPPTSSAASQQASQPAGASLSLSFPLFPFLSSLLPRASLLSLSPSLFAAVRSSRPVPLAEEHSSSGGEARAAQEGHARVQRR